MEMVIEASGLLIGALLGLVLARTLLAGVLAVTFGRRQ